MTEAWDLFEKDVKQHDTGIINNKPIRMTTGLCCFEVIKIHNAQYVENDGKRLSTKLRKELRVDKRKEHKTQYKRCVVDLRAHYWSGKPIKGQMVRVEMTHSILINICRMRLILKDYGLPIPKYILYWKPNRLTVKFTFIQPEELGIYKEYLMSYDTRILFHEFFWLGNKELFNELRFVEWYGYKKQR